MMCQAVCIQNFEILPSFFHFHFHFAVFVDDHGACSVKHVAAAEKRVGVCRVSSVCVHGAWRARRVHAKLWTIRSIIFYLSLGVCMFLQEMSGVTTKALVHAKVEGPTKGLCAPRQPLMHSAIHFCSHSTNIVLHIRVHLIVFLPETQDTTEWPSSRMITSWLACFYCIRHDQSQERALYTMFNMGVTTRLCPPSKIWKGQVLWIQNWNYQ